MASSQKPFSVTLIGRVVVLLSVMVPWEEIGINTDRVEADLKREPTTVMRVVNMYHGV